MAEDVVTSDPALGHRHHGHEPGEWFYACCACSGLFDPDCGACVKKQQTPKGLAYEVLLATHKAADELDEWDGFPSVTLGGRSPGGVVRYAAHEAYGTTIDDCPACKELYSS